MTSLDSSEGDSSIEGIVLTTPDPPDDVSFADMEDFRAEKLLEANGIEPTEEGVLAVLRDDSSVFQGTAAHVAGSKGMKATIPDLQRLAASRGDLAKVEAAYALALFGLDDGRKALVDCLRLPVAGHLAPLLAAGFLARLGDPQGFDAIVQGIQSDNAITRNVACKQLYYFTPYQGSPGKDGRPMNVMALFETALKNGNADMRWMALMQLRELRMPEARPMLETFASATDEPRMRDYATLILESLSE
jgi:HEAT repeat protein